MIKKLAKDISIYGGSDFVFKIIAFTTFPIYAHIFSLAEFGIMELVLTASGLIALFANAGLNNSTQRFYWDPLTTKENQPVIVSSGLLLIIGWSVAIVLLMVLCLFPFKGTIESRYNIPWIIVMLSLLTIIPAQILQYCLDVIRLHFNPWAFASVAFFKNLGGIILGLILILIYKIGLVGFFWGAFVMAFLSIPIALFCIRKDIIFSFDVKTAKQLFIFGYPFIFAGIAYWLFGSMDRWMLAVLSDNNNVGTFSIAFKLASIILFVNTAFGQAWSPVAIKMMRDYEDYRWKYSQIFSYWFFLLALLGAIISLFSYEILYILTPKSYWAATYATIFVVMGMVLSGTTQITALGISIKKKTQLLSYASWVTAVANFLLNLLLIPYWHATGAAISMFLSYGILTGLYLYWTQKLHPIPLEKIKLFYSLLVIFFTIPIALYLNTLQISFLSIIAKLFIISVIILGALKIHLIDICVIFNTLNLRPKCKAV